MPDTMKAVVITEPGGPEVLRLREAARPRPGRGELLVRVRTAGVNRADLLQRRGRYPVPEGWPEEIPGLEYAGTVEEVGSGVRGWSSGDRVMGIVGGGGCAEFVRTPASTVMPVPDGVPLEEAGAVPEVYLTAYDAIRLQEGLTGNETLLVHAVGSGVGTAALQMARSWGCRVLGTSRTPEKLERARDLGLEEAVLGGVGSGWEDEVLERTDGRGVDVILDLVGASYLAGNQRVLARRGRHIVVGVPSGARAEIDLRSLMGTRGSLRGTVLRARPTEEKAELARAFTDEVLPMLADGTVRPVVDSVLPAAEAAEAHRRIEANETFGVVLLSF